MMAGQIDRALSAIERIGTSKYAAKQEQDWRLGEAVAGLFSRGYRNTVFDRAVTFTRWLREEYPAIRLFREVDHEMAAEFLSEKAEPCTPDTVRTRLASSLTSNGRWALPRLRRGMSWPYGFGSLRAQSNRRVTAED